MKRVLTFGGAMYDIFIEYEQTQSLQLHLTSGSSSFLVLPEGKKIELKDLSYHIGGGAVNSAVSFSRQGHDATSIIKIGTDQAGSFITQNLAKLGVNTKSVITSQEAETGTSFIIPCSSGDRTILIYRGANTTIHENEISPVVFNGVDQLYVTSLAGQSAQVVPHFLKKAKAQSITTAINPGTTQLTTAVSTLIDALPFVDILILNAHEARILMQSLDNRYHPAQEEKPQLLSDHASRYDVKKFITCMQEFGIGIIAITNGAEGVYAARQNTLYFHPSIKAPLVSTVGAGDAFASTFVGSLLAGYSLEDALRRGICNSASVISFVGATTGLLSAEQLNKQIKTLDIALLQRFTI
jgi:sugar/nucleoside kinase (ribokinase family)